MPEEEADETYVEEEGLVVVHEGEKIAAAQGSEARLSRSHGEVHYYFPVEVVMVGDVGEETKREIEARIWDTLHQALS
jgi:hypothetical protein